MKIEFDVITPNLYVTNYAIYIGIDRSDVVPVSRYVDEVVSKHIGALKVDERDIDAALREGGEVEFKPPRRYSMPLDEYLRVLESNSHSMEGRELTDSIAVLFNVGYLIRADTYENHTELLRWLEAKKIRDSGREALDNLNKDDRLFKVDVVSTLDEARRVYEELDLRVPDAGARFLVVNGTYSPSRNISKKYVGSICVETLKEPGNKKVEQAKAELLERLKEFKGPALSFDVPVFLRQMLDFYSYPPGLVANCGDILPGSRWRDRFFRGVA